MQLNANIRMPQCHTSHYRFLLQYQLKGTLSCITQLTHLDATHASRRNSHNSGKLAQIFLHIGVYVPQASWSKIFAFLATL